MPEIKVRDTVERGIKTLDKPKVIRDKVGKIGDFGKGKVDNSSVVAYADAKIRSWEEKLYRIGKNTAKAVVRKVVPFQKETGASKSQNPKPDKSPVKTRNTPPPKTSGHSVKTNPTGVKVSQSGAKTSGQAAKKSVTQAEKTSEKRRREQNRQKGLKSLHRKP